MLMLILIFILMLILVLILILILILIHILIEIFLLVIPSAESSCILVHAETIFIERLSTTYRRKELVAFTKEYFFFLLNKVD